MISKRQVSDIRKKITAVIDKVQVTIEPKVKLGGEGWRNIVQTDERRKGGTVHGPHGKVPQTLGNYFGAVGKDPEAGYKKRLIRP